MLKISNNYHWLLEQADLLGNREAFYFNETSYTYAELAEQVKRAASFLSEEGINSDEPVLIDTSHSIDFVILINALWIIGAVPIPLHKWLDENELENIIDHTKSKYLICNDDKFELNTRNISIINFQLVSLKNLECKFNACDFNPDANCIMLFTSGSTHSPKCVQLTFNNIYANIKSGDRYINHNAYDVWLASLPFYHIGGFSIIARSIAAGCSLAIPNSLNYKEINLSIDKFHPSLISLVPTMLNRMLSDYQKPWKKLRHIFLGGGPADEDLIEKSLKNLWPVSLVYGATETSSMVTVCSSENLDIHGVSAGKPLEEVNIAIEPLDNLVMNDNQIGRIVIKSNSVSSSYLNLDYELDSRLKDGYFYTNDLGKIDSNGNLHIIGRIDDIIISGGENISLGEIEKLLNRESMLRECVCLGVKDEKWGQSFIVITDSTIENSEQKIRDYLRNKTAKHKQPRQIYRMPRLPKNDLGKVLKSELKKFIKADFL